MPPVTMESCNVILYRHEYHSSKSPATVCPECLLVHMMRIYEVFLGCG